MLGDGVYHHVMVVFQKCLRRQLFFQPRNKDPHVWCLDCGSIPAAIPIQLGASVGIKCNLEKAGWEGRSGLYHTTDKSFDNYAEKFMKITYEKLKA